MKRVRTFIILVCSLTSLYGQTFKVNSTSVEVGQTYTNWEIDFELAKPDIVFTDNSKTSLDSIVNFLKNNSTTVIEIGYHTAKRGKPNYNMTLSQQRASSIKKYIVSQGIDSLRLTTKGYGSTQPIMSDELTKGRRTTYCEPPYPPYRGNRRLTIKIIKK